MPAIDAGIPEIDRSSCGDCLPLRGRESRAEVHFLFHTDLVGIGLARAFRSSLSAMAECLTQPMIRHTSVSCDQPLGQ